MWSPHCGQCYELAFLLFLAEFCSTMNNSWTDEMRQTVLSSFHCPLQCISSIGEDYNGLEGFDCPFDHGQSLSPQNASVLRKMPSYVCVDHLMNKCANTLSTYPSGLVRCSGNRFHPSFEEIVDLDFFHDQVALAALSVPFEESIDASGPSTSDSTRSLKSGQTPSREVAKPEMECDICLEKMAVDKFGLLNNCSHHFCASCITEWLRKSPTCPICRKPSAQMS